MKVGESHCTSHSFSPEKDVSDSFNAKTKKYPYSSVKRQHLDLFDTAVLSKCFLNVAVDFKCDFDHHI